MDYKLRIGKDFTVEWSIFRKAAEGREAYNLENKRLVLRLQNLFETKELTDFAVNGNKVSWTFYGKDQKSIGSYNLILVENKDMKGMVTIDKVSAFTLVAHTEQESSNSEGDVVIKTISLESDSALLPIGGGGYVDMEFDAESEYAIANKTVTQAFIETAEALEGKQNTIADLDSIRSGAAKGATALQSVPAEYVTDSELSAKGYATTAQVAGKQDALVSGASIKTINGESILGSGNIEIKGGAEIDTSKFATKEDVAKKQDIIEDLATIRVNAAKGATAIQSVKTINGQSIVGSGNIKIEPYNDTEIKAQIANKQDVLISNINIKTINGESILGSGNIIVEADTTNLATKTELNGVSEQVTGKQDKLVSGKNIKTINGKSILGGGDLDVSIVVDSAFSETSENPLQNKVITPVLAAKADVTYVDNAIAAAITNVLNTEV